MPFPFIWGGVGRIAAGTTYAFIPFETEDDGKDPPYVLPLTCARFGKLPCGMLGSSTRGEVVLELWSIDTGLLPNTGAGVELGGLENKSCARDCSKAACLACLLGGSTLGWMAVTI